MTTLCMWVYFRVIYCIPLFCVCWVACCFISLWLCSKTWNQVLWYFQHLLCLRERLWLRSWSFLWIHRFFSSFLKNVIKIWCEAVFFFFSNMPYGHFHSFNSFDPWTWDVFLFLVCSSGFSVCGNFHYRCFSHLPFILRFSQNHVLHKKIPV